ncbi:MAG: hypothetical protein AB2L07_00280 [Thermoanaerobaculaceae bacterium]
MNRFTRVIVLVLGLLLSSCALVAKRAPLLPPTPGETASAYGYVPLDGLAVRPTLADESCSPWRDFTPSKSRFASPSEFLPTSASPDPYQPLLESLPDINVRFAVASFDTGGALTFGPAKITAKDRQYRAILDYVNVDAIPVTFLISAIDAQGKLVPPSRLIIERAKIKAYQATIQPMDVSGPPAEATLATSDLVTVPVYVGIGMRLSADITALEAGVALTSLGAIGLEAQGKRLTGTLTVQTLGITGEPVATSLPLPSTLDQTTIENGILAIGSNRAVVYRTGSSQDKGGVVVTPRIVGLYSPIGTDSALINALYSELSKSAPGWARPCRPLPTK